MNLEIYQRMERYIKELEKLYKENILKSDIEQDLQKVMKVL